MMSLPCAFFSTMPMFFHTLTASAPRATSASMCRIVSAVQFARPKPFMENVVAK